MWQAVPGNTAAAADHGPKSRPARRVDEAGVVHHVFVSGRGKRQAADQGQLVGDLCLQRQVFTDIEARHDGLDRSKLAAVLGRGIRLEVIHVDVAGPSGQDDQDDRLGWHPAAGCGPQAEQVRECQAGDAQRTDPQELATADAIAETVAATAATLPRLVVQPTPR